MYPIFTSCNPFRLEPLFDLLVFFQHQGFHARFEQFEGYRAMGLVLVVLKTKKSSEKKQPEVEGIPIWVFPKIVVPPKSSILIGFSIINHPFSGTPIFGNTHILLMEEIPKPPGMVLKLCKQWDKLANLINNGILCKLPMN